MFFRAQWSKATFMEYVPGGYAVSLKMRKSLLLDKSDIKDFDRSKHC